jgi:methylglutaconyl-CoA hydratase
LSELAVGIGPFVVGPAVERKTGNSTFTHMTINATEWQSAAWAREKGMYMETHPDAIALDAAVQALAVRLTNSSPEAMRMLKKIMWEGTEHWDTLLSERAEMSGKLVLTEFSKNAINKFKAKG